MTTYIAQKLPVTGLRRWALRVPIWLYRAHLGWLLGHNFLLLTHYGRKSGLPRQTVLEVVHYQPATRTYVVAAAWGVASDWYRNIQQTPAVMVRSGTDRIAAQAAVLSPDAAAEELRYYATHHPYRARQLIRLITGQSFRGRLADMARLAGVIPLVALRPR